MHYQDTLTTTTQQRREYLCIELAYGGGIQGKAHTCCDICPSCAKPIIFHTRVTYRFTKKRTEAPVYLWVQNRFTSRPNVIT